MPGVKQYDARTFYDTILFMGASFSADEKRILVTSDASGVLNLYSISVIDKSSGENPAEKIVLINPEIVRVEGKQTSEEGCLSVPGFREQVSRPKRVTIRAQNAKGEWFEMTGEELLARAFLHETDHLNGRLYITHVSMLKRDLIRRKVRKLQKAGEWG